MIKNKISQLIFGRLEELGKTKREMVAEMGYKNITKGLRRLTELIEDFKAPELFINECAKSLQIEKQKLLDVIQDEIYIENEIVKSKERQEFKPHICAMFQKEVPSPIFAGNLTYHLRFVYFEKEIIELPLDEQLIIVKEKVLEHFKKNEGGIAAFGAIIHYIYQRDYDEIEKDIILLDIKGDRMTNPDKSLRRSYGRPTGIRIR